MVDNPTQPPNPLRLKVPIVKQDGSPTPNFIRQWNQQRTINVTVDEVVTDLTALQAAVTQNTSDIADNAADIADIQDVDVVAGVGLSGGGNIAGPADVTVDLEDTAVTPGTYGSGTQVPVIAVDQQGRITSAVNTPITGGGGGSGSGGSGGGLWVRHGAFGPDSNGDIVCTLPAGRGIIRLYGTGISFATNSVELRSRFSVSGAPVTANNSYNHTSFRQFSSNAVVSGDGGSGGATAGYMALGISNQGND